LEETHRRISREIAKELNLGNREAGLLEVGSINPDSWANFPHHHGKEGEIVQNILEARKLFLQDDDECYHRLGIALHYIQDKWTLRPRTCDKHTAWEVAINSTQILDNSKLKETIKNILLPTKAEQAYLDFLEKIGEGVFNIADEDCRDIELFELFEASDGGLIVFKSGMGKYRELKEEEKIYYLLIKSPTYAPSYKQVHVKGLGKKVIHYALQDRPTTWSGPILDLNFAYRVCLEITRNVFSRKLDETYWYDRETIKKPEKKALEEGIEKLVWKPLPPPHPSHIERKGEAQRKKKTLLSILFIGFLIIFLPLSLLSFSIGGLGLGLLCIVLASCLISVFIAYLIGI